MTHSQLHAGAALGSALLVAAFVAFLPPVPPASVRIPMNSAGHSD